MAVEVKIGITDSPRELTIATSLTSDKAYAEVEAALGGKQQLLALGLGVLGRLTREVGQTAPEERDGGVDGGLLVDGPLGLEPVARVDLTGSDESGGEHARAVRIESGIVHDQAVHRIHTRLGGTFDASDDGRIGGVGGEDQPVAGVVLVDEVEERLHRRTHTLPVVGGGAQGGVHIAHQLLGMGVDDRDVEVQLGREVLIQDGFAHSRVHRDLVHPGGVVAALDEDLTGRVEQLHPPCAARQARTASGHCGRVGCGRHGQDRTRETFLRSICGPL